MALQRAYDVVITLRAGLNDIESQYGNILTAEDLARLQQAQIQTFTVNNAYHRVEQMQVTKQLITFDLCVYNADVTKLITRKTYQFMPDTSDSAINYHTQCYEYLKTLDEYTDAVDV